MKMKRKLMVLLAISMMICSIPMTSYAASKTVLKNSINLNSSYDLYGSGYHWDASKRTLTLNNANLYISESKPLIKLPNNGKSTILLKGENKLTIENSNGYPIAIKKSNNDDGSLTIKSSGKGSLYTNGAVTADNCETTVSNCILSIQSENKNGSYINNGYGNFTINNGARVYVKKYFNIGTNLKIDNGYLEVRDSDIDINSDLILKNKGEFHCINGCFYQICNIYADKTTVFEMITSEEEAISNIKNLTLLSKNIRVSAAEHAVIFQSYHKYISSDKPNEVILPDDPEFGYTYVMPYGEYYDGSGGEYRVVICKKGDEDKVTYTPSGMDYSGYRPSIIPMVITGSTANIQYKSSAAADEDARIKKGVESTKLTLKSSKTAKGNIALNWTKSAGYRMDYYEVFRSTSKDSGWDSEPIYTTLNEFKTSYTNTKDLKKGQTYYYRVRGVRMVDGEKIYTPLSTKAWRKK